MRILHIITSLLTGGAETLVVDIVTDLLRQGHEVDVVLFDGEETPLKERLRTSGCEIICFSMERSFYNPLYILKLRRLIKNYDIVHTHNFSPQLFTAIATLGSKIKRVTTEHNTSNRRVAWKWYRPIDRWMYNRYQRVICISDKAEENLRLLMGSHLKTEIQTIYNGINLERFQNAQPLPLSPDENGKINIVMVAAFRPQKDQDTLIKAMTLLPKDKYELWLVGDGERRAQVEELSKSLNTEDNAKFLGLRTDIPDILHTADVIVMSSHYEGLSLSSIEGMSVGKPFIASDVDGLHEITAGAGILFPEGDAKALATSIEKLMNNPDYYHQVATACLQRSQQYDIKKTINNYLQVYRNINSSAPFGGGAIGGDYSL